MRRQMDSKYAVIKKGDSYGLIGMDGKNAKKIYLRDRRKHASPNSAQTEAVMAGALDIRLAGRHSRLRHSLQHASLRLPQLGFDRGEGLLRLLQLRREIRYSYCIL